MTATPYANALAPLSRLRGVLGCLVVDGDDGIIIDAVLQYGIAGEAVAALAASLYRKARRSSAAAGLGDVTFLRLEAERGHLFAAGRGELVLVLIAEERANVGLVRVEMLKAVRGLA